MQRLIIGVVAVVVLGACGSGSTDTAPDATDESTEQDEATTGDASTDASDEPTADESNEQPDPTDEAESGDDGDSDGDDTINVDSLSDISPECVELFKGFLHDIEPIVSTIDWEQATINEFEQIGTEFDDVAGAFDEGSEGLGCDRFNFDTDDQGFDEMIALARDEAPGTVGFFEFLDTFRQVAPSVGGDGSTAGGPQTCDDVIVVLETLADEYGKVTNVPASEIANFGQATASLTTLCSAEELETLFDNEKIAAFLDE